MDLRIVALGGDGVGPAVTEAAMTTLRALVEADGGRLTVERHAIGWAAVGSHGDPLPPETVEAALAADAVFLGAVGSPEAEGAEPHLRPERGLLGLRAALGCWANLRPTVISPSLLASSPLRPEIARDVDLLVVRELGGGLYYGEPRGESDDRGWNTLVYERPEVERIARLAFEAAGRRRGRVTSIDKANVLEASRLWRRVVEEVATDYPEVTLDSMLVDRAALELVLRPGELDVIVTSNLFGDVLSDEAAALAGSLGVAGSASLGGATDLYEPVHGSAPDLIGEDVANPMGALASVGLLLRHTLERSDLADRLDGAVEAVLAADLRTADLVAATDAPPVGTRAFTDAVVARLEGTS